MDYLQRLVEFQSTDRWYRQAEQMVTRSPGSKFGKRVLDFGCGPGLLAALLQTWGSHAKGVDPDPMMISYARGQFKFTDYDVFDGRLDERFDYIFTTHVLGHVEDIDSTLETLRGALNPSGVLAVMNWSVWNSMYRTPSNFLKGYRSDPTTRRHFSLRWLTKKAAEHGFERVSYYRTGERFGWGPDWLTHALFVVYFRKARK